MSTNDEKIYSILKEYAGYITATQATESGIPRRCLTEMCADGQLCKVDRGIYATSDILEDEMYSLQYRYGKGIFSHGTALYLHSMTDRTPHKYTLTFPRGYNTSRIGKHEYSQTKSKATRQSLVERMKERQGFTKVFLEPSPFFLNGI